MSDGITNSNRVDGMTERKLDAKVVDTILNARVYGARLMGKGKPFIGKSYDYTLKITDSAAGEFFSGAETLNSTASDTTLTISYRQAAFQQPAISLMLESFANEGEAQTIDLDAFKLEEAVAEAVQRLGSVVYQTGAGNAPLGLGAIVDDGTDVGTIGGASRSTYTILNASRAAAASGILSLSVLATREDAVTASGVLTEEPNVNLTTKTGWTLYESLITPTMRADYNNTGYQALSLRGDDIVSNRAQLKGAAGFTVLSYRGKPVIKDDACPSGKWFMLNERYIVWRGRTIVPKKYEGKLEKISLGEAKTMSGMAGSPDYAPPTAYGWFKMPYMMLPYQAGMIARFYCIGQVMCSQFRRQAVLTGLSTV